MQLPRLARPLVVAIAVTGALLFAGCSSPEPQGTSSPTATTGTGDDPVQTPRPSVTPSTDPSDAPVVSEPVGIDCGQLITPDQMYAFNPNFSLLADAQPATDTKAAQIAGMSGLVCQWKNDTSGDTIDVAVAKLGDDDLTGLKNLAVTQSTPVPTYGAPPIEGYFTLFGKEGEAQVFSGPYWVTLRSVAFFEPGDAIPLVEAALGNLPA